MNVFDDPVQPTLPSWGDSVKCGCCEHVFEVGDESYTEPGLQCDLRHRAHILCASCSTLLMRKDNYVRCPLTVNEATRTMAALRRQEFYNGNYVVGVDEGIGPDLAGEQVAIEVRVEHNGMIMDSMVYTVNRFRGDNFSHVVSVHGSNRVPIDRSSVVEATIQTPGGKRVKAKVSPMSQSGHYTVTASAQDLD